MKIGELFVFGFEPSGVDFLTAIASEYGLGGIIVFERNLPSLDLLRSQIAELKQAVGGEIIVCVDQEGGEVNRLADVAPVFPSMSYYAQNYDLAGLEIMAGTTARHLRRMNINLNLAPVCDVLTDNRNELLRKRSFGTDPKQVSEFSSRLIDCYHSFGIACCAKHFPGLGASQVDPHKQLAVSEIGPVDFDSIHWQPYRAAIAGNVDMIMTTHLMAPALDPKNMATFSNIIIDQYLRQQLGFEGVVISDDLGMGAVVQDFTPAQRALQSLHAGHDLILFCHSRSDQENAFNSVLKAYNNGELDKSNVAKKIDRIKALKGRLSAWETIS